MQSQPPPDFSAGHSSARFDVGRQDAGSGMINNVGRDQYFMRRENFLREVAATRTKARWLVWTGLALFILGFGVFAAGILNFMTQVTNAIGGGYSGPPEDPFGEQIGGVPSGLLGWAVAAVGVLLIVVGSILHVVATSRRKQVDRDMPLPYNQWRG